MSLVHSCPLLGGRGQLCTFYAHEVNCRTISLPETKLFTFSIPTNTISAVTPSFEKTPAAGPSVEKPVDPNIQIKFTIIFGILALIPFVLFYFYGLDRKTGSTQSQSSTNRIPVTPFKEISSE